MTITPGAIARTFDSSAPMSAAPPPSSGRRDFGLDDVPLVFKLELLQHSGSFKTRGAVANLLTREVPAAGVVAASGGNHGAAVAYAAHRLGKPAKIFVPSWRLRPRSSASAVMAPTWW